MNDLFTELEEEGVRGVWSFFGMPVTAYALCLALSLALGLALLAYGCKKKGMKPDAALIVGLLAIPLGLLGARLFYCAAQISLFDEIGLENILYLWQGGYALWGAIGGAALAGVIAARILRQSPSRMLDAMAPAGALAITLGRFAEYFSGDGRGPELEGGFLCFFPAAVYNETYETWELAVFVLEGLAALIIFLILLRPRKREGDAARLMILLYAACQVLLESLRRDDFLRWMFVRVSQLTSVIVLFLLMLAAILRLKKENRLNIPKTAWCMAGFFACIGVCVWMEFAVDKSPDLPVWACYLIMAAACAGLGTAAYQVVMKE